MGFYLNLKGYSQGCEIGGKHWFVPNIGLYQEVLKFTIILSPDLQFSMNQTKCTWHVGPKDERGDESEGDDEKR